MVWRSLSICLLFLVSHRIGAQAPLPIQQLVSNRGGTDQGLVPYSRDFSQYDRGGNVHIRTSSLWHPETAKYEVASIAEHYGDSRGLDSLNRNSYYTHYPDSVAQIVENAYEWNDQKKQTYLRSLFQSSPGIINETRTYYYMNSNGCNSQDDRHWFYNGVEYDETITDYTTDAHCNRLVTYIHSATDPTYRFAVRYDYEGDVLVRERGYVLYPDSLLTKEINYSYDSLGNLVLEQNANHSRIRHIYELGREVQYLVEISYDNDVTWMPYAEDLTSYNAAGSVVESIQNRNWDDTNQAWSSVNMTVSTYNVDNNMTLQSVSHQLFSAGVLSSETVNETAFMLRCDGVVLEKTTTATVGPNPGITTKTTIQYLTHSGCETGPNSLITIYPNPASSYVQVLMTEDARPSSLKIFSPTGQLVNEFPVGLNPATLDVSSLSPGIYIVEASDGTHRQRSSMVKY